MDSRSPHPSVNRTTTTDQENPPQAHRRVRLIPAYRSEYRRTDRNLKAPPAMRSGSTPDGAYRDGSNALGEPESRRAGVDEHAGQEPAAHLVAEPGEMTGISG